MVKLEDVMNTLYKAQAGHVNAFANALYDATDTRQQVLDGKQLDKLFSFGMMLTYCEKCREQHWFVAFAEHGTPLKSAVPDGLAIDLIPVETFEEAVTIYKDIHDSENEPKH